ncbi:porin family protein [Foetidibacter luteolus]|uniref:porin family protein n=1 Tax=Foetidibacter luteolus TaxID=2608880 RepID=UPI00129AF0DE|nr:porin family protein [Foetidibacter luteolus]
MKKILLAALLLTSATTFVSAQSLHIGAKAGANLNKVDGQAFKDGFQLGYHLGGFVELDFSKTLGIQPEVLFNQTNTKTASNASDVLNGALNGEKKTLNYLSIPVLLRINAGQLLTFHVGPQFSILTNKDESIFQNGKNAFKSGDLAAVLGAQVNLGSLKVYGRYNIGLSNISDIDNTDKWKNQQIQLGVGLRVL